MKKYLLLSLLFILVISCKDKKEDLPFSYHISAEVNKQLTGKVLLAGENNPCYNDLQVTEDYYVLLDAYGDTLLYVYSKKDLSLVSIGLNKEEKNPFLPPYIVKYDYRNKDKKNHLTIWDNKAFYSSIYDLDRLDLSSNLSGNTTRLHIDQVYSRFCVITEKDIYGVPLTTEKKDVGFYSFNPRAGYYYVPAFPVMIGADKAFMRSNIYAPVLCVNEKKDRIVAPMRYINTINFYDLNCDRFRSVTLGEDLIFPVLSESDGSHDAEASRKCFIDAASSDQYIYCLFDGTHDYSSRSLIVVLDWEGRHVETLQADRNLRHIALDREGGYLLALSGDREGIRDLVRYKL